MSRIIVDSIRNSSAGSDGITLSSDGKVAFPNTSTGKILQVYQKLDTSDYSTTGTSYAQGPETDTFTLSNSSNKVLVLCNWMAFMDARSGSTVNVGNALYRGSVASGSQISLGGQPMIYFGNTFNFEYYGGHCFLQYLDTPGGNTTYSLAVRNITGSNSAKIRGTQQTTTITLIEIAA